MPDATPEPTTARPSPLSRRAFLSGAAAGVVGTGALGLAGIQYGPFRDLQSAQSPIGPRAGNLPMPGLFPGRVIEVHHAGAVTSQPVPEFESWAKPGHYMRRDRDVVRQMIARGMRDLVGSEDAVQAWRHMFQPGDRVGIKVVPVGRPNSISSHEVVLEVIEGLRSAGVHDRDILLFERYRDGMLQCGYDKTLPEGVHWECASAYYDELQLNLDGQVEGQPWEKNVSGYDPDVYRELPFCSPDHDPKDDRRFRSHLCNIVSRKLDKVICIPVLKDHRSSGVTLALKNLSHGFVNNVARSHIFLAKSKDNEIARTMNQCGTFIPSMVSLPPTRAKAVLQILDGLVGTYEGGPGNWNRSFATWDYNSLFFSTDPVAIDRIGWEVIDEKRAKEGWPSVAAMGTAGKTGIEVNGVPVHESFHIRQPEHIPLAGTLGLGTFLRESIDHQQVDLT